MITLGMGIGGIKQVLVGNLARHLHGVTLPHGFSIADATPALLSH